MGLVKGCEDILCDEFGIKIIEKYDKEEQTLIVTDEIRKGKSSHLYKRHIYVHHNQKYYFVFKNNSKEDITDVINNGQLGIFSDKISVVLEGKSILRGSLFENENFKLFNNRKGSLGKKPYTLLEGCCIHSSPFLKVRDDEGNTQFIDKCGKVTEQTTADGYLYAYKLSAIKLDAIDPFFLLDAQFIQQLLQIEKDKIKNNKNLTNSQKLQLAENAKDKIMSLRDNALSQQDLLISQREENLKSQRECDEVVKRNIQEEKEKLVASQREDKQNRKVRAQKVKDYIEGSKTKSNIFEYLKEKTRQSASNREDARKKRKEDKDTKKQIDDTLSMDE